MKNILALILLFSINGYGQPYSYRFDEQMMSRAWGITQNSPFDSAFIQRIKVLYRDNDSVYKFAPVLDTVRVVIQYSDSSKPVLHTRSQFNGTRWVTEKYYPETAVEEYGVYWMYAYSVREKHNTIEGVIDPYFYQGRKYHDYFVHLYYLDENKRPLSKNIIVWQDKEVK
jgi:hypothetical protein